MPQPTRAKRKEHRIKSPDHLNWSSNSGSPTSRLPSLRYITFPRLGLPICKMRAHLVPCSQQQASPTSQLFRGLPLGKSLLCAGQSPCHVLLIKANIFFKDFI